jgi:surface polysaccharide O-acyltransferase-like enzyme
MSGAAIAWIVFGAFIVACLLVMALREIPAMRREARILKM